MWWLPLLAAGGTGILNALSGDDRKEYTRAEIEKLFPEFDEGKLTGDLMRMISARIKSRRGGVEAQNLAKGLNNPTDVYSNEEDLINAEQAGLSDIRNQKKDREDQITRMLATQEIAQPRASSFFERFGEGAIQGAGLGLEAESIFNRPKIPKDPITDTPVDKNKPVAPSDTAGGLSSDTTAGGLKTSPYLSMFKKNSENPLLSDSEIYKKYLEKILGKGNVYKPQTF